MHTHTSNTRNPWATTEHNSRNGTCLTPIPSHNSRDTFRATTQGTPVSRPSRYHQSLVDHAPPKNKQITFASQYRLVQHTSPRCTTLPDRLARDTCRQAPSASAAHCLQVSPSETTFTARRYRSSTSLNWPLSLGGRTPPLGAVSEPTQYWFKVTQTCFYSSFEISRITINDTNLYHLPNG